MSGLLAHPAAKVHLTWPDFDGVPRDPAIRGIDDLVARVAGHTGVGIPTLLLWGDTDPISPVQVGRRLAGLLPRAALHVFPGADHSLGCSLADRVAPLIDRRLMSEQA